RLATSGGRLGQTLHTVCTIWVQVFRQLASAIGLPEGFARPYLHDPFAVALAGDPTLAQLRPACVRLQRVDGQLRLQEVAGAPPNMEMVTAVDAPAFKQLLGRCLAGLGEAAREGSA